MGLLKPVTLAFVVIIVMYMTMVGGESKTTTHTVRVIDTGVINTGGPRTGRTPTIHYLDALLEDGEIIRVYSNRHISSVAKRAEIVVETQYSVFGYVSRHTLKAHHLLMDRQ